jgi:hypothetical protein
MKKPFSFTVILVFFLSFSFAQLKPGETNYTLDELSFKTQLLFKNPKEKPKSGTSFILTNGRRYFLVSAHHVINTFTENDLIAFPIAENKALVSPLSSITKKPFVWHSHDSADVSTIEIFPDVNVTKELLDSVSVPNNNIYSGRQPVPKTYDVAMFGYPFVDELGKNFSPIQVETKPASGLMSSYYERQGKSFMANVFYLQSPSMQGMSGGPVFYGYFLNNLYVKVNTMLIGVNTAVRGDTTGGKFAMVMPSYYLIDLVNKAYP